MKQLVFVYGTLRPGERYHYMLTESEYLGRHRTHPRYTMLDLGAFPGIIDGGCTAIVGDVFAVDPRTLTRLDEFEDYPREYARDRIATAYGEAWIYLYRPRPARARVITSGDWCNRGS
ncbi:MAG: gamma-glutamylcyclotransferase [Acidiferrobacterales bacterium]